MNISKRLKAIADLISDGSYIMDVGCDHAYLCIYLAKEKNCYCIASDINEGPLKQAILNIEKYNVKDRVKVLLQDGIKSVDKDVDTIVISGMGTSTIIDILSGNKENLNNIKNIIISSNNDYYKLRYEMMILGFSIRDEKFIKDRNKYYLIIDFTKGNIKYSKKELEYGPVLLNGNDSVYKEYLKDYMEKQILIRNNLGFKNILLKFKLNKKIKEIERLL